MPSHFFQLYSLLLVLTATPALAQNASVPAPSSPLEQLLDFRSPNRSDAILAVQKSGFTIAPKALEKKLPSLIQLIADPDTEVAAGILKILSTWFTEARYQADLGRVATIEGVFPEIRAALSDPREEVRLAAVEALELMAGTYLGQEGETSPGLRLATPSLLRLALQDQVAGVAGAAQRTLEQNAEVFGLDHDSRGFLAQNLSHRDPEVVLVALSLARASHDESLLPHLISLLKHKIPEIRFHSAMALENEESVHREVHAIFFERALHEQDEAMQGEATQLWKAPAAGTEPAETWSALQQAFSSPQAQVRTAAALLSLKLSKNVKLLPAREQRALVARLKQAMMADPDARARMSAASALARMGPIEASYQPHLVAELGQALAGQDTVIRDSVLSEASQEPLELETIQLLFDSLVDAAFSTEHGSASAWRAVSMLRKFPGKLELLIPLLVQKASGDDWFNGRVGTELMAGLMPEARNRALDLLFAPLSEGSTGASEAWVELQRRHATPDTPARMLDQIRAAGPPHARLAALSVIQGTAQIAEPATRQVLIDLLGRQETPPELKRELTMTLAGGETDPKVIDVLRATLHPASPAEDHQCVLEVLASRVLWDPQEPEGLLAEILGLATAAETVSSNRLQALTILEVLAQQWGSSAAALPELEKARVNLARTLPGFELAQLDEKIESIQKSKRLLDQEFQTRIEWARSQAAFSGQENVVSAAEAHNDLRSLHPQQAAAESARIHAAAKAAQGTSPHARMLKESLKKYLCDFDTRDVDSPRLAAAILLLQD